MLHRRRRGGECSQVESATARVQHLGLFLSPLSHLTPSLVHRERQPGEAGSGQHSPGTEASWGARQGQHKDGDQNISLTGELVSARQNELSPGGEAGRWLCASSPAELSIWRWSSKVNNNCQHSQDTTHSLLPRSGSAYRESLPTPPSLDHLIGVLIKDGDTDYEWRWGSSPAADHNHGGSAWLPSLPEQLHAELHGGGPGHPPDSPRQPDGLHRHSEVEVRDSQNWQGRHQLGKKYDTEKSLIRCEWPT